jgi:hypothetical protein
VSTAEHTPARAVWEDNVVDRIIIYRDVYEARAAAERLAQERGSMSLRHGEAGVIVLSASATATSTPPPPQRSREPGARRPKWYPNVVPNGTLANRFGHYEQRKGPGFRAFSVIAGAGFEPATFGL